MMPRRGHPPGRARAAHPASALWTRVLAVVRRIPAGRVATYGDIATLAGRPRAWRAVGRILRECHDSSVPCHRVIGAGGRLGGFAGHPWLKCELLRAEGLVVTATHVRHFDRVRLTLKAR